uniref:Copia protein n=1 Tax=Peronospora matthiolae TaxID=2874970 RepID=A0AAV1TZM1_9STRA
MKSASLRNLVEETLYATHKSIDVDIGVDKSSAMTLELDPTFSRRTRHIELHWHYVREQVRKNKIILHKVTTEDNAADLLKKATSPDRIKHLSQFIELMDADKSDTRNGLQH